MRLVVLLLVIANLAWWGAAQLNIDAPTGREPERLAQQIEPERLRIVARGEPPPTAAPAATPGAPPKVETPPAAQVACIAYGGLVEAVADAIVPVVTRRTPEVMVTRDQEDIQVSGHRVQINRLGSRAAAERKAGELRRLGINDFSIVGGGGAWVVSLGVFASEAAAQNHLGELRQQGVRTARVQAIVFPGIRSRVTVSGPASSVARAAEEVRHSQPELEGEACVPPPEVDSAATPNVDKPS